MDNGIFNYHISNNTIIFTDTIKKDSPYVAETPRNHESLFFVTNGTAMYDNGKSKTTITKGQVGYIARGSVDMSSADNCSSFSYIAVNFNFAEDDSQFFSTLPFDTVCSSGTFYNYEKLFSNALTCFRARNPGSLTAANGILLQIIGYLYNEHIMKNSDIKKAKRIEKSVEYMKNHYDDTDFKIGILSDISDMSEKHFRRVFFDVYNKTPFAYLQEFRIDQAEILLQNTSKSISDIAIQCGFSDVYSFSHCFKRHIGISPNKYRIENT